MTDSSDFLFDSGPTILGIRREQGVAGQYALHAHVMYPGEGSAIVTFVGSSYGGPIVMRTSTGIETFVSSGVTDRIGSTLDRSWVRAFFH